MNVSVALWTFMFTIFFTGLYFAEISSQHGSKHTQHASSRPGSLSPAEADIEKYTTDIENEPRDFAAYANRAFAYGTLGKYTKEIEDCDKAITLWSAFPKAYNNRGWAKGQLSDYRGEIVDCSKAIILDPKFAIAYYNRGCAYGALGQYHKQMSDCEKAIELRPDCAQAYNGLGWAFEKTGNYRMAITNFTKAMAREPASAAICLTNRGEAYRGLGEYKKAITDFDQAIATDQRVRQAFEYRKLAYEQLKQQARRETGRQHVSDEKPAQ